MLSQIFREGISHMLPTWISSGHHFPSVTTHEPEKTTAKIFLDLANALRLKPTVLSGLLPTFMFLGQMIILLIVVLYFFIFLHFINYFSWKRQLKNQVNCVTRHGIPFIFFTIFHSYSFFFFFPTLFFHSCSFIWDQDRSWNTSYFVSLVVSQCWFVNYLLSRYRRELKVCMSN